MKRASVTEALFFLLYAVNPPCLQRADGGSPAKVGGILLEIVYEQE
jgi:hypothetical protein